MTIEEYGTLSEEELAQEIISELEENGEIDPSDLDFKFENDKLKITGTLQTEDELEVLIGVLEDYVDPKDYRCEVEILEEGVDRGLNKAARFHREPDEDDDDEEDDDEDEDYEDYDDDNLEEVEEEDLDADETEDEEEDDTNNKW